MFMLKIKNLDRRNKLHAILAFPAGSFEVHIGNHLRFRIICRPIWGSFLVWGSFAVGDHLRRCTGITVFVCRLSIKISLNLTKLAE